MINLLAGTPLNQALHKPHYSSCRPVLVRLCCQAACYTEYTGTSDVCTVPSVKLGRTLVESADHDGITQMTLVPA